MNDEGKSLIQNQGHLQLIQITSAVGTGADMTIEAKPDSGEDWSIVWMIGRHDDSGGARDCYWQWFDSGQTPNVTITLPTQAAMTTAQRLMAWALEPASARERSPVGNNLSCTHKCYPKLTVKALAATGKAYIEALVYRRQGVSG